MPPAEKVPTIDSFLVWFDSLPTDVQREILQRIFAEKNLLFSIVDAAEFFADHPLHVTPGDGPMLTLN